MKSTLHWITGPRDDTERRKKDGLGVYQPGRRCQKRTGRFISCNLHSCEIFGAMRLFLPFGGAQFRWLYVGRIVSRRESQRKKGYLMMTMMMAAWFMSLCQGVCAESDSIQGFSSRIGIIQIEVMYKFCGINSFFYRWRLILGNNRDAS